MDSIVIQFNSHRIITAHEVKFNAIPCYFIRQIVCQVHLNILDLLALMTVTQITDIFGI